MRQTLHLNVNLHGHSEALCRSASESVLCSRSRKPASDDQESQTVIVISVYNINLALQWT